MKKKEITIGGIKVTLAYCYAFEIAFRDYTGQDFSEFIREIQPDDSGNQRQADPKKLLYAILSAIMAYYQSADKEPPVTDRTLMFECPPQELINAFGTVMQLYAEWYHVPEGEPKDNDSTGDGAKN
ncbi:MAG: hypothetical protein J1E37_06095 [Prevotella sp.]|nr:hypothetical protein [Prevotella sp.]